MEALPASDRQRHDARAIFDAGVASVDARVAVARVLSLDTATFRVGGLTFDRLLISGVRVVGAGKAVGPMVCAVEESFGSLVRGGIGVTKDGQSVSTRSVSLIEAAHPVPDARSLSAGKRIVEAVSATRPDELLLMLLSGGASSLAEVLPPEVTLEDLRTLTEALLHSGAPIEDVNTVRRALSLIKGGGLLQVVPPGVQTVVLVLSDVLGNALESVGSGPMVRSTGLARDALSVLVEHGLTSKVAPRVLATLRDAADTDNERGQALEARARQVTHVVVGDNKRMAEAAAQEARRLGYPTLLLSTFVEGEAREIGCFMAGLAREISTCGRPLPAPACIVASGETTVTVRGTGRGGRNQEMALAFARHAAGLSRTLFLCGASDGTDGPTEAAGAIVDGLTTKNGQALGLDARAFLSNNDSHSFFAHLGGLLVTGLTGTNTNDLFVLLVGVPG